MWPELSNRSHLELFAAGGRLRRAVVLATVLWLSLFWVPAEAAKLEVGSAHADITPEVRAETPVWLAGYYPGRAATGVHDPLYARGRAENRHGESGLGIGRPDRAAIS